jgi:hypothetical protein
MEPRGSTKGLGIGTMISLGQAWSGMFMDANNFQVFDATAAIRLAQRQLSIMPVGSIGPQGKNQDYSWFAGSCERHGISVLLAGADFDLKRTNKISLTRLKKLI